MQRFHDHTPRDEAQFGKLVTNAEGQPFPNLDMDQKWNCLVQVRGQSVFEEVVVFLLTCSCRQCQMQAVLDIIRHLDEIWKANKRVVLDYAVWYREKHKEDDTYTQFIQLVTCHCIVHSDFLAPGVTYPIVPFV